VVGYCVFPENARGAKVSAPISFYLGQAPVHPNEAMKSIQVLQRTAATMLVLGVCCRSARPLLPSFNVMPQDTRRVHAS
jgi:hypothetical protein